MLGSMAHDPRRAQTGTHNASMAHPTRELVGGAEAALVIDAVRTLLAYFDAKQRKVGRSTAIAANAAEPF